MARPVVVIRSLTDIPTALRGAVVALGNFDGMHLGHQAVIARAVAAAKDARTRTVLLTFEPHPRTFFSPDVPVFRLTPAPLKAEIAGSLGVDAVVELPFDARFAAQTADAFIETVLHGALAPRHVLAGFDFHFGKGRGGTPEHLVAAGTARGFTVDIVPQVSARGEPISASRIREDLATGDLDQANAALGWRWLVDGTVIKGDARGRVLGFPTANMALAPETRLAHGVYAVRARIEGSWYTGAASYGRRPQFDNGPALLETYVCDFSGDLYGRTLRIEFCAWLRGEERFASINALVDQMGRDVDEARRRVTTALRAPASALQAMLEG